MALRRVLLFLKPFDVYPPRPLAGASSPTSAPPLPLRVSNPKVLSYLDDRCRVHKETINLCKSVLQRKSLDWISVHRNDLSNPIDDVDLVISVGGDGTLLRASHFLNSSIPVLGVNSDPTCPDEVDELTDEFDARRSTGHLCAATAANFEQGRNIYWINCCYAIGGRSLTLDLPALRDFLALVEHKPATHLGETMSYYFQVKNEVDRISALELFSLPVNFHPSSNQ
ncbi:hypothetical protein E2562_031382 [Oryza meyeriana var. granulata]|uniref:NADH kinase n=1 Tax=Oryza meyeriana var. granulata TaxID=110450 RepID=A0A6G1DQS7_9ORYZ|nr:hypothetical protein E2562_031382 [Oryza meyeriana var. granulata]